MCGIAGFVNLKKIPAERKIICQMVQSLRHRGPDEKGTFIKKNIALGIRRLSIIDLVGGSQPISNENNKVTVVFNGEIYNFKELRNELIVKGHRFKSQSDTEVIVHLYEEEKEKLFERLNGMFAIALWDDSQKELFLARDRFGEKPLYFGRFGQTFIFGSELKSLLCHPKVKRELDFDSLSRYLTFEYVPAPHSIFKNIYKLDAGCYLVLKETKIQVKRYWDVKFNQFNFQSKEEILEKLGGLLDDSVKRRLVADVPLGVFLSGGIDSSTISFFAAKNSPKRVKSFSIGFEEESFDESLYAKSVASQLGLDHHHQIFREGDLLNLIPKVVKLLDEPFADASILPTYLLSQFAKEKVKVVLGGDGGDELFMGYPTFQAHRLANFYTLLPNFIHKGIVEPIVKRMPVSYANFSFDFKAKKTIGGIYEEPLVRNQVWLGAFTSKKLKQKLFNRSVWKQLKNIDPIEESINEKGMRSFLGWNAIIFQYLKTYLADGILMKVDRASMFNSLEVRSPFLDYRLVDFVNSIPPGLKLKGFTTKYILKQLMKDKLPSEIINRSKHGFGIPVAIWLRTKLKHFLLENLDQSRLKKEGIFYSPFVNRLVDEHLGGKKDNRKLLWTLVMFELWRENWA